MQATVKKPFCLADFRPFLRTLTELEEQSVLIGGMAVSAWADVHLELSEPYSLLPKPPPFILGA